MGYLNVVTWLRSLELSSWDWISLSLVYVLIPYEIICFLGWYFDCWGDGTRIYIWRFPEGYPQSSYISNDGIFHEINQPFWGNPMTMETSIYTFKSSISRWDFPWNKPTISGYPQPYGNLHLWWSTSMPRKRPVTNRGRYPEPRAACSMRRRLAGRRWLELGFSYGILSRQVHYKCSGAPVSQVFRGFVACYDQSN